MRALDPGEIIAVHEIVLRSRVVRSLAEARGKRAADREVREVIARQILQTELVRIVALEAGASGLVVLGDVIGVEFVDGRRTERPAVGDLPLLIAGSLVAAILASVARRPRNLPGMLRVPIEDVERTGQLV